MNKSTVKVSAMTGKLAGLQAINSSPCDNAFCEEMSKHPKCICSKCYSRALLNGARKNCRPAWKANGEILSQLIPIEALPVVTTELVRFSAHGELINYAMLVNFMNIARKNPDKSFGLWTKRKNLLAQYLDNGHDIPDNVVMVYSNPIIDKPCDLPKGFHKVFNVVSDKHDSRINCGARSCNACRLCYSRSTTSQVFEFVK